MKPLLYILLFVLTGCQNFQEVGGSRLTPQERQQVVVQARKLATESGLLSDAEKSNSAGVGTQNKLLPYGRTLRPVLNHMATARGRRHHNRRSGESPFG